MERKIPFGEKLHDLKLSFIDHRHNAALQMGSASSIYEEACEKPVLPISDEEVSSTISSIVVVDIKSGRGFNKLSSTLVSSKLALRVAWMMTDRPFPGYYYSSHLCCQPPPFASTPG